MSRKYLNERWCVRCNRTSPCPYLLKNIKLFNNDYIKDKLVLDCGCGNGRNSNYLKSIGFKNIMSLDMAGDFGTKMVLGKDNIPADSMSARLILCNYVFMFLNDKEGEKLFCQINSIADVGCYLLVELYPAKDSYLKTKEKALSYQKKMYNDFAYRGWKKVRYSQQRFILEKMI